MNQTITQDYREKIRQAMETRAARNPRYSMRSFARDLGMSPSRLSEVLKGRYGLSLSAASEISKSLGFSPEETAEFCDQVESKHSRDMRKRQAALVRLASYKAAYQAISLDAFQVISDWYHYAILELMLTKDFQSSPEWIAHQLDLSVAITESAIERLKRLEMISEDSHAELRPSTNFSSSPDGVPSDAIKKFHRQILEKAILAIDFQSVGERDLSSIILAVDASRVSEAKQEIKKFRREFDVKFGSSENKNQVYCLSTQFFRLQAKAESSYSQGDIQ